MGFTKPDLPPVDPATFLKLPLMERTRILATHWAEYGFGSPRMVHTIYIVKLVVFYGILGITIAKTTSGLGFDFWNLRDWWNEPIVYQKFVLWTVFLEAMNLAGSWGPLAGKAKPMMGGILFWGRLNTIRLRPWKWVPGTAGDRRTVVDLVLYYAFLVSLVVAIGAPGVGEGDLARYVGDNAGLVNPVLLVGPIVLLILNGLRCKVVFLGARGEQYLPMMVFFAIFGGLVSGLTSFPTMIVALKMLILIVWVGAGFSKFGKHFSNVVPPMVSNAPSVPFKAIKRAHYKNFPNDLRPSGVAHFMAHVNGTFVEIAAPLILFFATNKYIGIAAAVVMIIFHLFIISTFPLAVPLEWNVVFAWATAFLFLGFPNWATTDLDGSAVSYYVFGSGHNALVLVVIAIVLLFFPVLGNLRPDKVSFLPSMRQYAGNWASAVWAFKPGAEEKLNRVTRSAGNQIDQFVAAGYEPEWAEVTLQMTIGWRTKHSQARGLFSLLLTRLPDVNERTVREGEFLCNSIMGFNFGDGHFHNEEMIKAVQDEAQFEPGEVLIAWVESEAFGSGVQEYKLIDPAIGVVERGTWKVADAVKEQPWLPNGPIPLHPTWTRKSLTTSES